jgi:hypothetical protein
MYVDDDEPEVILSFTLSQLRHLISALLYNTKDLSQDLDTMETNSMMLELLLQVESDEVGKLNLDLEEEERVRKFGEK